MNGVKQSGNQNAVVAVEGAGNANDHWRTVHSGASVVERLSNNPRLVSLLRLTVSGPKQLSRYAHSYIGIGLTAEVGKALNQEKLNALNEKRILLRELSRTKYFKAQIGAKAEKLDSLVAANINQMAKVIKLEKELHLDSSHFRLIMHKHRGPWQMLVRMIGAALSADESFGRTKEFELLLLTDATIQCDGEVYELPRGSTVKITGIKAGLKTL